MDCFIVSICGKRLHDSITISLHGIARTSVCIKTMKIKKLGLSAYLNISDTTLNILMLIH